MSDEPREPNAETPPPTSEPPPEPAAKRITYVAAAPPPVKLEIYEGPLDLLLDLIRKQQLNIYDIPIAKITQQYLDYLHMLKELNIDVAGEFIFMAATLIYIKSRMLLPPDPTAPAGEEEDPRQELVHRLLEHEQFKNAAQMLQSKRLVEDAMWSQPGIGEFVEAEDEPGLAVTTFDLIAAFREILILRELEGCSYKEIAAITGRPIGTVMSALARARRQLRTSLVQPSQMEARHGL